MRSYVLSSPIAVQAFFKRSWVLTFAAPRQELTGMIPKCLELDTFKDQRAFLAVALVQTSGLRPKGFPKALGTDFFLIGYRTSIPHAFHHLNLLSPQAFCWIGSCRIYGLDAYR